jgi:hypothetical protein
MGESIMIYFGLCLGVTLACYARVSTADQQLDRQIESITHYAQNRLGASLQDVDGIGATVLADDGDWS